MPKETIMVVDDEADIITLIEHTLRKDGYTVVAVSSGEEALSAFGTHRPDAVLLDLMLPGVDGLEVCKKIKSTERGQNTPIIMLTAKSEDADIVLGLELGADDYITKPFSPKVLTARLRAVLRRAAEEPDEQIDRSAVIDCGAIKIDVSRHEVSVDGSDVNLSATEFAILEFLAKNPGWVFSRDKIIDSVKGKDYPVTERSVDVQILGLRKKLGTHGSRIQTVRGVGYRLTLD